MAEENFKLAFDSVDEYLTKVSQERLLNEPGMETLRSELLKSASSFFEEFTEKRQQDRDVRAEYVAAIYRQAKIEAQIARLEQVGLSAETREDQDVALDEAVLLAEQVLDIRTASQGNAPSINGC